MIITAAELQAKRLAGLPNIMRDLEQLILHEDEAGYRNLVYDISNKQGYGSAIIDELTKAGYTVRRKITNTYSRDGREDKITIGWK